MVNKKRISVLLIVLIFVDFVVSVMKEGHYYIRPYNHKYFSQIYSHSQYVLGQLATRSIGDDGLYPFAGYYYITGGDPSQVNFENPTIGKYLIGLSVLIFKNENAIYLLYALLLLFVTYHIANIVFKNQLLAIISVLILEISPFFKLQFIPTSNDQLSIALLDLPLTLFVCSGIYFFLRAKQDNKWRFFFLSSFFLGISFAIKFFPSLLLLIGVLFVFLFREKEKLKKWFISLLCIPLIYLVSYSMYFVYHPSFIEFLRYQKWIINWRLGNPYVVGNIWRTIITGKYLNWWDGKTVTDTEWKPYLAFVVVGGLCGGLVACMRKQTVLFPIVALVIVYLLYLTMNTVGVARYLMVIYPLLVVLVTYLGFEVTAGIIRRWKQPISKR